MKTPETQTNNLTRLAAHDLRHALVAHVQHAGDVSHRQPVLVGGADRFIPFSAKRVGALLKLGFAPGVVLSEVRQARAGLGCMALGTGDIKIVGSIPAIRLA